MENVVYSKDGICDNNVLQKGHTFTTSNGAYEIVDVIGRGASSVAYRAKCIGNGIERECILKEYNPSRMRLERKEGVLTCKNEGLKRAFKEGKKRFFEVGQLLQNIRNKSDETKNMITYLVGIVEANNTFYYDTEYKMGMSYCVEVDNSLENMLKRLQAIVRILGEFHEQGYLYLDLKPDNIYIDANTTEVVTFFDFDTVVKIQDAHEMDDLMYTPGWAAPELKNYRNREKIGPATDLFSVGELLFYMLMGRHSEVYERGHLGETEEKLKSKYLENINPKAERKLRGLLDQLLHVSVDRRIQSAEEVVERLQEMIKLSDPRIPFIKSNVPEVDASFVGRQEELEKIFEMFKTTNVVFLHGMGGIGKSELAKKYASEYRYAYDVELFVYYEESVNAMFRDLAVTTLYNVEKEDDESERDYQYRAGRKWKSLVDDRTLLVVDNLDNPEAEGIEELEQLGCKVLVTSRVNYSGEFHTIEIGPMVNRDSVLELFTSYYERELSENEKITVWELLCYVEFHTMMIKLLALQMKNSNITPKEMLEAMTEGIESIGEEKIKVRKDNKFVRERAAVYVRRLFVLSELSYEKRRLLLVLSLITTTGATRKFFRSIANIKDYNDLNDLIELGWIQEENGAGHVKVHRIIRNLSLGMLSEFEEECYRLMKVVECAEKKDGQIENQQGYIFFLRKDLLGNLKKNMGKNLVQGNADFCFLPEFYWNIVRSGHLKQEDEKLVCRMSEVIVKEINETEIDMEIRIKRLCTISDVLWRKHFYLAVIGVLENARVLADKVENSVDKCKSLISNNLGITYMMLGKYVVALPYLEEQLELYLGRQGVSDYRLYGLMVAVIKSYYKTDISEQKMDLLCQQLDILYLEQVYSEEVEGQVLAALDYIGMYWCKHRQYEKAERAYLLAIKLIGQEYGSRDIVPRLYGKLAYIYGLTGVANREEGSLLSGLQAVERPLELMEDECGNEIGEWMDWIATSRTKAYILNMLHLFYQKVGDENKNTYYEKMLLKEMENKQIEIDDAFGQKQIVEIDKMWESAVRPDCYFEVFSGGVQGLWNAETESMELF